MKPILLTHRRLHRRHGGGAVADERAATTASPTTPCATSARDAFAHIQNLPLSYLDAHPTGDIVSRMIADVDTFADGLLMGFTQLFTGVMTILGTLGFMLTHKRADHAAGRAHHAAVAAGRAASSPSGPTRCSACNP